MAILREIAAMFSVDVDTKQLDHANEKIEGFIDKLKHIAEVAAGAFAVKEIFEFVEHTAAAIHQVERTAAALGITTEATQELGYAAKASGENAEELLNMMGRLQVSAAHSSKAGGQMAQSFAKLGVKVKDASGQIKPADALFEDVAEGISKIHDPAKRAALATELFGRQGRQLLPFLVKGKAGIEALRKEFGELGGGFDEESMEAAKEFEHNIAKVKAVVVRVSAEFFKVLAPAVTYVANKVSDLVKWFIKLTAGTNVLRNGLITIGLLMAPLAINMAIAFAPLAAAAVGVAFLILLFDDLFGMFEGKDSVIGRTIDELFGKDAHLTMIKGLKAAWEGIRDSVKETAKFLLDVLGLMDRFNEEKQKKAAGANIVKTQGETQGGFFFAKEDFDQEEDWQNRQLDERLASVKDKRDRAVAAHGEVPIPGPNMTPTIPDSVMQGMLYSPRNQVQQTLPRSMSIAPTELTVNNNVTVNARTDADPKEIGRVVAETFRTTNQEQNKSAKHVLTQAGR